MSRRHVWHRVQQSSKESTRSKIHRAARRKSQRTPSAAAQSCAMGAAQTAAESRTHPGCLRFILGSLHGGQRQDESFADVISKPVRIWLGGGEHRGISARRGRGHARMDELSRASRQHPQYPPPFRRIRDGAGRVGAAVLDRRFRRMKSGYCRTQRQPIHIIRCLP